MPYLIMIALGALWRVVPALLWRVLAGFGIALATFAALKSFIDWAIDRWNQSASYFSQDVVAILTLTGVMTGVQMIFAAMTARAVWAAGKLIIRKVGAL